MGRWMIWLLVANELRGVAFVAALAWLWLHGR